MNIRHCHGISPLKKQVSKRFYGSEGTRCLRSKSNKAQKEGESLEDFIQEAVAEQCKAKLLEKDEEVLRETFFSLFLDVFP